MVKILIASRNVGKLLEMRTLLADLPAELITPREAGVHLEVMEDGLTYRENAGKKALEYAIASGLLTLADDSGLEVDVLNGLPGIRSARFAPMQNATDADRRDYLITHLDGYPRPWSAHFHCTAALATPQGRVDYFTGTCNGEVIPEERGVNGFGYDPIFLLPELGLTLAELDIDQKNCISHRAKALAAAYPVLMQYAQPEV